MKNIFPFVLVLLTVVTLEGINTSAAQDINDENLAGKIYYDMGGHSWSDLFGNFINRRPDNKRYYERLCPDVEKICKIITQAPAVNPPRGFNTDPVAGGPIVVLPFPVPFPGLVVTFCNYPLYIEKKTGQVKRSGTWGSSIRLYVNDPEMLFNYSYRIEDDCDTAGVPVFCFRPAMHRDKNGFWVSEGVRGLQQVRIIKKKGVPLYTPVSQKEFLEFEIKFEQKDLIHCRQELTHDKKLAEQYPQDQTLKDDVGYSEDNVTNTIKAIRDYQKAISTMSAGQLNQSAYMSIYYTSPKGHYYFDLVPPTYKGATGLVRLNRQYFDTTLPAGTVQLIMLGTTYSTRSASPDIIQKVKTWYDGIDYEKLQAMIR